MKKIRLTKGRFALVDDEDFESLSVFTWHTTPDGYAARMGRHPKRTVIRMHREIMCAKDEQFVDHIDGDKLDNRRSNLRFADKAQNSWNTGRRTKNMLGLKGVQQVGRKFKSRIMCNGKLEYLGTFVTAEEAFAAYCRRGKELHGEFFNPLHSQ